MAYLGNVPARSFISFERQVFTIVNSQTAYTLSHSVTNENDIRLVVNNIVQEPGSGKAYTASGTTLTLSAALVNGTDEMYCVFLGRAVGTVNAPAGSVDTAQLASEAVTDAKVASSIITGQTAETSIASDDLVLLSDTSASGALKKMTRANFVSGVGGTNTPAFYANRTSGNQSLSHDTATKIQFNVETFDTDGTYDHTTNYRWTPGVVGKYIIGVGWWAIGNDYGRTFNCYIYKNGSQHIAGISRLGSNTPRFWMTQVFPIDVTSTSDYFEAYAKLETNDSNAMEIHAGSFSNYFYGYKLLT